MFTKTAVCAAALSALSTIAVAQEFSGGELGIEFRSLDGGNVTKYQAGAELSFNRTFAVAVDAAREQADSDSLNSGTLHGIYHLNDMASVGAYYGVTEDDVSFYGIEGGTVFGFTSVGGYLGQREGNGNSGTALGLNIEYPISQQFELFSEFDYVVVDDVWVGTEEIGAQYNFDNGPELYALFGQVVARGNGASASSDYFGIGGRITFGAGRGTTFEGR